MSEVALTTRGTPRIRKPKVARPKVNDPESLVGMAFRNALDRCAKQGVKIDAALMRAIEEAVDRANGRCEVTGLPFSGDYEGPGRRRPWLPTVDRIDATRGYEAGNVRLVCCAANIALNDWGDDVFNKMVDAAYRKRHA